MKSGVVGKGWGEEVGGGMWNEVVSKGRDRRGKASSGRERKGK